MQGLSAPCTVEEKIEALWKLSTDKQVTALQALLVENGLAALEAWKDTYHKNRVIHRLAIWGHAAALEALAHAGADLNLQRESDGCTAAHLAFWHGQPVAASRLVALGADVNVRNKHGETVMDLEERSKQNSTCWHQQADLLLNIAPIVLRQAMRERWSEFAGPSMDIGATIVGGSLERVTISSTASARAGLDRIFVEDDLRRLVSNGQSAWLNGIEIELASDVVWASNGCSRGEFSTKDRWASANVTSGVLEVQKIPPEGKIPLGHEAERKVRRGRLEAWDLTLLAHFLCDEQSKLACNLVPDFSSRKLVRELRDVRNKAALHLGRAEVEPKAVNDTAELVMRVCKALAPSLVKDVQQMVDEALTRKIVPEDVLRGMETQLDEERARAEQMAAQLQEASRFRNHVPPTALSGSTSSAGMATIDESASEWSAVLTQKTVASTCRATVVGSIEQMLDSLELPDHCSPEVVERCLALASECPKCSTELFNLHMSADLLLVVRTTAPLDNVMLDKLSHPDVHAEWKARKADVYGVQPSFDVLQDWCLPDGVLVSGEHGRILRVSAQFRPPPGPWTIASTILRKALDITCAAEAVVIISSEGQLYACSSKQACNGVYFRFSMADEVEVSNTEAEDMDEAASVFRGAETATDCDAGGGSSTLKKMGDMYWPFMVQREGMTDALHRQAEEHVHRWGNDSSPLPDSDAVLVADNTAKFLWKVFEKCRKEEAQKAIQLSEAVCSRLKASGHGEQVPKLLLPMAELERVLGNSEGALELLKRARRLSIEHDDFEIGFSSHQSLFALLMRFSRHIEARAVLESAQRMLDKEKATRDGPGMDEFAQAKQLFQSSNLARLDAKLALASQDAAALEKAKVLLEGVVAGMTAMRGSSFRGNTGKNLAELLSLLCYVAMACHDATSARKALEQELALRKQMDQPEKVAMVNVHLARALLGLNPPYIDAAESHLEEAKIFLQGGAGKSTDGMVMAALPDVLRLQAKAAELRGDTSSALALLRQTLGLLGTGSAQTVAQKDGVLKEIARLQARQRANPGAARRGTELQRELSKDASSATESVDVASSASASTMLSEVASASTAASAGRQSKAKPRRKK